MIVTEGSGRSDRGRVREQNEDALLVDEALGLYAVVDGMGGAAGGEVAARVALEALAEQVRAASQALPGARADAEPPWLEAQLRRAVELASEQVFHAARADPALRGMGCALTAVWIGGATAVVAHVGDTRLYLVRDGVCHVLTRDHTFIQELRELGRSEATLADHPYRHALVRAIGTQPAVVVDTTRIDLIAGDRLLLCTDGLTGYVPEPAWIAERVGASEREDAVEGLIRFANESGGEDNATVLIVDALADPAEAQRAMQIGRTTQRNLRTLGATYLLEGLTLAQTSVVLSGSEIRTFDAGAVLLTAGQPLRGIYVVLDGELAIQRQGVTIRHVAPGDCVGDEALVEPRFADDDLVAARAGTAVLCLSRDGLLALCAAHPALGVALLWRLAARLAGERGKPSLAPR